jgi:hypothetical protein
MNVDIYIKNMSSNLDTLRSKLLGVWRLVPLDMASDGALDSTSLGQPYGPNPLGRMMFTSEGYMSAMVTDPDHAKPIPGDIPWRMAPERDLAFVARPMISYCGGYKVYYEEGNPTLSTEVEVSMDPSWIGTAQVRKISFENDGDRQLLVLRPVEVQTHQVSEKSLSQLYSVLKYLI